MECEYCGEGNCVCEPNFGRGDDWQECDEYDDRAVPEAD